ncbi:LysR family transcriptional regulator [Ciceribacter sp. L1K23]|uniref:LysR substrate-binding domain-containing protein n=1 Tax=Ciceribacter sp. L1K23 TaxID=2820276 RepID=UPI001B83AD12|nr:LysR substrate-binding domain-containing protein [Ciceribacter sp. L1K23]MBR0554690.1 LysR family transcriptional regulator [Ciceribacter sp. L1K23]
MKLARQFPLNALRVFETVARLENFTRAGEELGMTQTAVSYQIKLLEEHLGEPVFIRKPRALQLTPAGERLLPKVSDAFNLLAEAVSSAQKAGGETLEIHTIPTFASQWLARNLGNFQLAHPEVAVRLLRIAKFTDFRNTTADVSIFWGGEQRDDLVYVDLLRPFYSPLLSPKLAATIGGIETPADLLKLPLISPNDSWWLQWFQAAGLSDPKLPATRQNIFESQDLEASAALAGQGVAIVSPFFFPDELASGRLIQPFDLALQARDPIRLVYPKAKRNQHKIRAFHHWIETAIQASEEARRTVNQSPDVTV